MCLLPHGKVTSHRTCAATARDWTIEAVGRWNQNINFKMHSLKGLLYFAYMPYSQTKKLFAMQTSICFLRKFAYKGASMALT